MGSDQGQNIGFRGNMRDQDRKTGGNICKTDKFPERMEIADCREPIGVLIDLTEQFAKAFAEKKRQAVDAVVQKMPKRLLKAFPKLTSKRNPASVPLARESMARKGAMAYDEAEREAAVSEKSES